MSTNDKVYILEMDRAKAEALARGADELGEFAKKTLARIDDLEQELRVALEFVSDLLVLICPPSDEPTYYHVIPLTRRESIEYMAAGATKFLTSARTLLNMGTSDLKP